MHAIIQGDLTQSPKLHSSILMDWASNGTASQYGQTEADGKQEQDPAMTKNVSEKLTENACQTQPKESAFLTPALLPMPRQVRSNGFCGCSSGVERPK